jgi:3-oxoacyl-[acyl-carrier-protein] synthase II
MGCIMGVGIGGLPYIEKNFSDYLDKGLRRISPFFIPGIIANMGAGMLSIRFNLQGTSYSTSSACASASHAIGAACQEIMLGRQDVVISGGAESVICLMGIGGFSVMKALSRNENFQQASRPFDSGRDGFVMGEGAGMLVLEDLEKAQNRGAKIYAEIVGFAASSDANHITAPHPEGLGARNCMLSAIESADIKVEDIDYVNAHGTSTPLGDIAETKAIRKTFGQHAEKLLVSSTKSMTGHLLGAAGGIESVFCIKALATGQIPPTINLVNQDPECDLNYVPLKSVQKSIQYALNNSFGFGGTNATTIFKKFS